LVHKRVHVSDGKRLRLPARGMRELNNSPKLSHETFIPTGARVPKIAAGKPKITFES